jgi:hypothetical protein
MNVMHGDKSHMNPHHRTPHMRISHTVGHDRRYLSCPRPLDQNGIQHFLPAVQALHVGLVVAHNFGHLFPVLAIVLFHSLTQPIVLWPTRRSSAQETSGEMESQRASHRGPPCQPPRTRPHPHRRPSSRTSSPVHTARFLPMDLWWQGTASTARGARMTQ